MRRQVFFNCSANGILPISVAVYSVLKTAEVDSPLDIYIAHDTGFGERGGREQLCSVVARFPFASVHFANFDPLFESHRETLEAPNMKWPLSVWAWCFCTQLFPEITDNLVFVDWDMLVLKDLKPLFELDLKKDGMVTAAVDESRREHRPYLVAAGWPEEAGYAVNTGLQVIDTDTYRRDGILKKILDWYAQYKDISLCVEQDALNAVAGARIRRLHIKYNFTVGWCDRILKFNFFRRELRVYPTRDVFEAVVDPCVLHFIGHKKPWHWNHRAFRRIYRRHMEELGLFDAATYGETFSGKLVGAFFDLWHCLIRQYARLVLVTFLRSREHTA